MFAGAGVRKAVLAGIIILTLAAALGLAGTVDARAGDSDWRVELVPYIWMVNISGDVTVRGIESSSNVSFSDIWDSLDFAAEAHLEVWKGPWAFFLDPTYLKNTQDATVQGIPITVKTEVALVEFGGIYRLLNKPLDQAQKRMAALELLVGGRYNSLKGTLELPTGYQPDGKQDWVDPFVGGRVRWDFLPGFELILRSDIGGFDIGSKVAWNNSLLLQYKPVDWMGLVVGYRYLYMDYEDGSGSSAFKYDVTMQGPIFAVHFSF